MLHRTGVPPHHSVRHKGATGRYNCTGKSLALLALAPSYKHQCILRRGTGVAGVRVMTSRVEAGGTHDHSSGGSIPLVSEECSKVFPSFLAIAVGLLS